MLCAIQFVWLKNKTGSWGRYKQLPINSG